MYISQGNVSIDVARILVSDPLKLSGTDIATHAVECLNQSEIRHVHMIGRRGPIQVNPLLLYQ